MYFYQFKMVRVHIDTFFEKFVFIVSLLSIEVELFFIIYLFIIVCSIPEWDTNSQESWDQLLMAFVISS